jgi:hypothetical protein
MLNLLLYLFIVLSNPDLNYVRALQNVQVKGVSYVERSSLSFSMENRYENEFVNGVFVDNILLTLNYLDGRVTGKEDIVWEEIQKPSRFEFTLNPGEGFSFHDQVLAEFSDKIVKTTGANFNFQDGFKSSGRLYGDGVCHLASFIHMAALEAGLTSVSLARHDFAKINEVPREFGVSIKYMPGQFANSSRQNLYVINNQENPVTFVFDYDGVNLAVKVVENSSQVNENTTS